MVQKHAGRVVHDPATLERAKRNHPERRPRHRRRRRKAFSGHAVVPPLAHRFERGANERGLADVGRAEHVHVPAFPLGEHRAHRLAHADPPAATDAHHTGEGETPFDRHFVRGPLTKRVEVGAAGEEVDFGEHEEDGVGADDVAHASEERSVEIRRVHNLDHEHLFVADAGELFAEFRGGDESGGELGAALARDGVDHAAVGEVGASRAQHHAVELAVLTLGLVLVGGDVPGHVGEIRLERDAATVTVTLRDRGRTQRRGCRRSGVKRGDALRVSVSGGTAGWKGRWDEEAVARARTRLRWT